MTKEEYISIRDNPKADTSVVLHYFFELRSGRSISREQFNYFFGLYLQFFGIHNLSQILYKVFVELDKHFRLEHKPTDL